MERKDRVVEDVRILRVVVGAAFEGRFDRVNDRVEDYRRLLEKRKSVEQKKSEAPSKGPVPQAAGSQGTLSANRRQFNLVKHQCG
jgi:hypothetical protein